MNQEVPAYPVPDPVTGPGYEEAYRSTAYPSRGSAATVPFQNVTDEMMHAREHHGRKDEKGNPIPVPPYDSSTTVVQVTVTREQAEAIGRAYVEGIGLNRKIGELERANAELNAQLKANGTNIDATARNLRIQQLEKENAELKAKLAA